jgi:ATP-dependent RNA helicase DeaD
MESFRNLGLSEPIIKAAKGMGFATPTDIQLQTIPHVLAGKDVIAGSATGSGKTFAFGAPLVQLIEPGKGIQAMILAPTRELAEQIQNALIDFSRHQRLRIIAIYGGVSFGPQFAGLKTADIVVGTPGRMLDHLERKSLRLDRVRHIVLDEADRMLDMGFLKDVSSLMQACTANSQTLLFSATLSPELETLSRKFMHHPERVALESVVDPAKLSQVTYEAAPGMKYSLLVYLLRKEDAKLVMVFSNSRKGVDVLTKNLKTQGVHALAIHGGLSQAQRNHVIGEFNRRDTYVLICTEVAARGLDIPGVSHVYNYDFPRESKQYIHRIGRTARAGAEGKAINLISAEDRANYRKAMHDNGLDVAVKEMPHLMRVEANVKDSYSPAMGFGGGRAPGFARKRFSAPQGSRDPHKRHVPGKRPGAPQKRFFKR